MTLYAHCYHCRKTAGCSVERRGKAHSSPCGGCAEGARLHVDAVQELA